MILVIVMMVLVPGAQVLTLDNVLIPQLYHPHYLETAVITALAFISRGHNALPYQQTSVVIINIVSGCVIHGMQVLVPVLAVLTLHPATRAVPSGLISVHAGKKEGGVTLHSGPV